MVDTSNDGARARVVGRGVGGRGVDGRRAAGTVVALLVAGSLALSACTPTKAGSAAVVGDRRVTTTQVDDATQGIKTGNPQLAQGDGLERTVLFYLVIAPWVLPAAEANGVGISEQEAAKLLPQTQDPDPAAVRVIQTFLALQKLQSEQKTEALTQVQKDITAAAPKLAPRYGTFDVKQMAVVDAPGNWLVPASEPTPTSAATP